MSRHTLRRESGSALLEAALVMPVFFLMVAGTIQFGHLYTSLIVLRNASTVAARTAVLGTNQNTSQVCESARAALDSRFAPALLNCLTSPQQLPVFTGTPITVTLSYPVPLMSIGSEMIPGATWTLTAQTTMQ
jgi:Flp pilus assembly protein TadG